jgi:polysaccharide export outer membrane protein
MVMMMAGMLGFLSPSQAPAGSGDAAPLSSDQRMSAMATDEEGYLIGPGDVLDISVWKDEALTRSCVVRPDGSISFPLIGDVRAAGRTVSQLKAEMEKKIDQYVPQTTLSLDVKQVNSLVIFVIGKVNAPGRFYMIADVDVLQALATAGGLNVFAKRSKIKIFRHEKNETTIFPFDYDEVVDGIRLEQNIRLKRGDIVVIP